MKNCPAFDSLWTRCRESVFQIFHNGIVPIRVGDFVGLYFPSNKKWFSMYKDIGHTQGCPGRPNPYFGFSSSASWSKCGAEIFRIYAKGKKNGQMIRNRDTIFLYYPAANGFVEPGYGYIWMLLRSCKNIKWSTCQGKGFEIRLVSRV